MKKLFEKEELKHQEKLSLVSHLGRQFLAVLIRTNHRARQEKTDSIIKDGASKILKKCSLPLTGVHCVKLVVTDLAVLILENGKFHLLERAPGVSVEEVQKLTEADLVIPTQVPEMTF